MNGKALVRTIALSIMFAMPAGPGLIVSATPAPSLSELAIADRRAVAIGYRLALANVDLCRRTAPLAGFTIGMLSQYAPADRPSVATASGLRDLPTVLAVAGDSPAARAGIVPGDILLAVDGGAIPKDRPETPATFENVARAESLLDAALSDGKAMLSLERGGRSFAASVEPVRGCAVRWSVGADAGLDAGTDNRDVVLNAGVLNMAASDDEAAMVAGHELAHVILADRRAARRPVSKRQREDHADALGMVLAVRAGYDATAAATFWSRFAVRDRFGFLRAASHRSAAARARLASMTAARIGAEGVDVVAAELLGPPG